MSTENALVSEIPPDAKEVTLEQAAELLPELAGRSSIKSYVDRLIIHDPVIRVYCFAALRKNKHSFTPKMVNLAMHVAERSSYLRQLLVPYFIESHRRDLVNKLIELEGAKAEENSKLPQLLLVAQRANNFTLQIQLHERLYLQTGDVDQIQKAFDLARQRLPWGQAWKHVLRMLLIQSKNLEANLINALQMFEREGARSEYQILARLIAKTEKYNLARIFSAAQINFWKKNYVRCMELLNESGALGKADKNSSFIFSLAARCTEAMGDYEQASKWYAKQNEALASSTASAEEFRKQILERAKLDITGLEKDERANYFMMLGFPRSGTTLLENALSAHSDIATCEETSSFLGPLKTAYSVAVESEDAAEILRQRALIHRKLYYQSIDSYIPQKDFKVAIDKTPILSANIKYMEKIFANKRYIFSIRHPYDVVLSNIKQAYMQNNAMAAFNDMHSACVQYDEVMTDWFDVFPGETDRVCYVRYEELVEDFQNTIERVLKFLGVDWKDEVLNFADHSKTRAVRTPSYANVRKGLTIGVQTSWQNFDFMFDAECRALLDPWVKYFNYEVQNAG